MPTAINPTPIPTQDSTKRAKTLYQIDISGWIEPTAKTTITVTHATRIVSNLLIKAKKIVVQNTAKPSANKV